MTARLATRVPVTVAVADACAVGGAIVTTGAEVYPAPTVVSVAVPPPPVPPLTGVTTTVGGVV